MKKLFLIIFILLLNSNIFPQFEAKGTMGIFFTNSNSLRDYLNRNYASNQQVGPFFTTVVFNGELGYEISNKAQLGLDLGYLINSFTYNLGFGNYEFAYNIFMPSAIYYYIIKDTGYKFKFGAGAGPRFTAVNETIPPSNQAIKYSSTGIGFILRSEGHTTLGENFYAVIGVDVRYDMNGEPENNGKKIGDTFGNVKLNSIAFGIALGVSYNF